MRTPATRLSKHYDLPAELNGLRRYIESSPASLAGRWASMCYPLTSGNPRRRFAEVRVDYGSGMGDYLVESAQREPDVLFVGMEKEPVCIAKAARKAARLELANAIFSPIDASRLSSMFGSGEVSVIHINFPTPYARKHDAAKRMTHLDQLMDYRRILAPDGVIRLKTDSQPLRDFTLTQFKLAGYQLHWCVDDVRQVLPDDPWTGYEKRLVAKGATVYALEAAPGPAPKHVEQTADLSLFDYLPEDLESMTYVPLGMERSVENLIHARAKIAANHARIAAKKAADQEPRNRKQ